MAEFYIKERDTLPRIESTLTDGNDDPVDIAQADVYFTLVQEFSEEDNERTYVKILDEAVAVNDQVTDGSDGSKGMVHYDWEIGDTDVPGGYLGQWVVVFVNGGRMTFPNNDNDTIAIIAEPGTLGS